MKNTLKKRVALTAALLIGTSAITLNAANIKKTIEAAYYNIKVTIDGQYKTPTNEPFMVGDSVYVGLRDFSELTGNKVEWDGANKTVKVISGQTGATSTEIANKNLEIAKLKAENDALKNELKKYEEEEAEKEDPNKDILPDISQRDLDDMIEDLVDDYEGEFDIDWRFDLVANEKEGCLELKVSLNRSSDLTSFEEITEDELQDFLEEVTYDIQKALSKVVIKGDLTDNKGKSLTTFEASKTGKVSIQHQKEDAHLDRLNVILKDEFEYLNKISGYFTSDIEIKDIVAESSRSFRKVNISVATDLTDKDKWNDFAENATKSEKNILAKNLSYISSFVEEYFDMSEDDIAVSVYDSTGKILLSTYDANDFEVNKWN